jgi:hypothetical protein
MYNMYIYNIGQNIASTVSRGSSASTQPVNEINPS